MLRYRTLYSFYWNTIRAVTRTVKSPGGFLVGGFAGLILLGGLLLRLPFCHAQKTIGFLDALFTSASAVCVTGLVTMDTEHDFTLLGQLIILLLIQIGGLGVMTYAAVGIQLFRQKLSLVSSQALEETLLRPEILFDLRRIFRQIVLVTFGIEAVGALILFVEFLGSMSAANAAYAAIFHAISAFCNAGFSLWSDSLCRFSNSATVLGTLSTLIILGGLGHTVLLELWDECTARKTFRLSFHSRLVLFMSGILLLGGWGLFALFGTGDWLDCLFQSVTSRTAGFNAISMHDMPPAAICLTVLLMVIGGSPGSCSGGIKTTTIAVWLSWVWAQLSGKQDVCVLGRRLAPELVARSRLLVSLAVILSVLGVMFLLAIEGRDIRFADALFEQVSAFGTVGLTTGITPGLSAAGKVWIIFTMFIGRLGPLTLAFWAFGGTRQLVRLPEGKVVIG